MFHLYRGWLLFFHYILLFFFSLFSQITYYFCLRFSLQRLNEDVYADPNLWKIYTISYFHYSTLGTIVGIAVGLAVSLLFPLDQEIDPKLLTPFVRHFMFPGYVAKAKENKTNMVEEYAPVAQQDTKLWRSLPEEKTGKRNISSE